MKKTIYYVIGLLFVGIVSHFTIEKVFKNSDSLISAFKQTSCNTAKGSLEITAKLRDEYMTKENRKLIITKVASDIGLKGEILVNRIIDEENKYDTMNITRENISSEIGSAKLNIDLTEELVNGEYRYHILVKMEIDNQLDSLISYKKIITESLEKVGEITLQTMNIVGDYNGKLSENERLNVINDIMGRLNGRKVKHIVKEDLDIIYGYTKLISDSILDNGNKVNFNIAFSYDELQDKTYLYLASPIITLSY